MSKSLLHRYKRAHLGQAGGGGYHPRALRSSGPIISMSISSLHRLIIGICMNSELRMCLTLLRPAHRHCTEEAPSGPPLDPLWTPSGPSLDLNPHQVELSAPTCYHHQHELIARTRGSPFGARRRPRLLSWRAWKRSRVCGERAQAGQAARRRAPARINGYNLIRFFFSRPKCRGHGVPILVYG
jgi:hypothetical protein